MRVLYPGTFDPVTFGHLDVIQRAVPMFKRVIIAVSDHGRKNTLFTLEERIQLMQEATQVYENVEVIPFNGLAVEVAETCGAKAILRGLRVTSDFEYEYTMAKFMAEQNADIQPVYLMAGAQLTHISSSAVKEIAKMRGDITRYVPKFVGNALLHKLHNLKEVA